MGQSPSSEVYSLVFNEFSAILSGMSENNLSTVYIGDHRNYANSMYGLDLMIHEIKAVLPHFQAEPVVEEVGDNVNQFLVENLDYSTDRSADGDNLKIWDDEQKAFYETANNVSNNSGGDKN